jgi:hypothetical protein
VSNGRQPLIFIVRNPDWGFGIPILGWLFRRQGWLVRLEEAWTFTVREGDQRRTFTIPKGFLFDMASIPALLWGPPFNYSPFGTWLAASLEHDFLCVIGLAARSGGDPWLREAMGAAYPHPPVGSAATHDHFARRILEDGTRASQAAAMAKAVKTFGPRWHVPEVVRSVPEREQRAA